MAGYKRIELDYPLDITDVAYVSPLDVAYVDTIDMVPNDPPMTDGQEDSMPRPRGVTTYHEGDGEPLPDLPVGTRFRLHVGSTDSGNWVLETMLAGWRVLLKVRVTAWTWLVRDEPRTVAAASAQTEHSGPVWYMEV